MAPDSTARGTPRGRGAPRGRGRGRGARGGRGRGGSSAAAAATDPPAEPVPDAPDVDMNEAPAAPSSEPNAAAAPSAAKADPVPSSSTAPTTTKPVVARPVARGGSKFLPRAIRRSQYDREAIAAQESAKQLDREKQDARMQRAARGGRGRGRRARGGSPANFDRVIRGGMGGFGSGIQVSSNRAQAGGSFGRLYDSGSAGGGGGGGGGSLTRVKSESGPSGFNSESSRPTGRRMNTDKIVEYITIEDDDDMKTKEGTSVLLPKGMIREEPKEPEQPEIATTAEVEAADRGESVAVDSGSTSENGDIFFDENEDVAMKDDDRKWPGANEAGRVKIEGEEITEIEALSNRRAMERKEQESKKKKKKTYKDIEDRIHDEKMAYQRRLFGIPSDDDSDPDVQEDKTTRKPRIVDGSLYIFQFPPILPPLHKVEKKQNISPVKDEPSDDVVMPNAPAHNTDQPVDLTADDAQGKQQEGVEADKQPEENPEGFLGKLIIRKSGKMQIDYGGMIFECEAGIPVHYLRTAVLAEMADEKTPEGYSGTAYGMGQIAGKFNAVPCWSEEKPWIVDPSELLPDGVDAADEDMIAE